MSYGAVSTESYVRFQLEEIFDDISLIKSYDISYCEIISGSLFGPEKWIEIKLQISEDDLTSHNVMCKLLNEDSIREKIKKALMYVEKCRVNLTTYK